MCACESASVIALATAGWASDSAGSTASVTTLVGVAGSLGLGADAPQAASATGTNTANARSPNTPAHRSTTRTTRAADSSVMRRVSEAERRAHVEALAILARGIAQRTRHWFLLVRI